MVLRRGYCISILIAFLLVSLSCAYIVLPEGVEKPLHGGHGGSGVWTGIVTSVSESDDGALHINITIRNDTGEWSTMRAVDGKAAQLTTPDGKKTSCATVVVGTGGHRLAPGFQMRGYIHDEVEPLVPQLLYVECAGAAAAPGSTLSIDYVCFNGELDYYIEVEETNKVVGTLELNLDEVVTDLVYPVAETIEGLIQAQGVEITALSDNVISLKDIQRTESGFQFTWQNYNPSKFALKTHIGIPPVIGNDGIIYGIYETLDMPEVPLTPGLGSVEWTTEVAVPEEVGNLYILLSVESKKPRTYLNYLIDITGQ